jgi:hypothetical protein
MSFLVLQLVGIWHKIVVESGSTGSTLALGECVLVVKTLDRDVEIAFIVQ